MADPAESLELIEEVINDLSISLDTAWSPDGEREPIEEDPVTLEWGFPLANLFKLGYKFYKDKEGKAVSLSYDAKLRLVACCQQATHGPLRAANQPPLGVLDVIGRDRRDAWHALGDLGKDAAMLQFIRLLDESCPAFKPFVEAQKADVETKRQQAELAELRERKQAELQGERQEQLRRDELEKDAAEERKRQIKDALNAQTFHQFKEYANQQYAGNPEQQAVLVRQLQEQHYHQYMTQLLQQQHRAVQTNASYADALTLTELPHKSHQVQQIDNGLEHSDDEQDDGLPAISPPSMWTRKEIQQFKDSIRKEGGEAIIKVGRGETVTVRVPTHDDGTCLFWEFATDGYDIGFGVYFEWTKSETNQVSVHIQDSDEEEDDILDEDDLDDEDLSEYDVAAGAGDVEAGARAAARLASLRDKPALSAIVPIFRRDCQAEVYAGSHVYPGQGVYLLKFDNSYSLWRSKTLFYRVYYTR